MTGHASNPCSCACDEPRGEFLRLYRFLLVRQRSFSLRESNSRQPRYCLNLSNGSCFRVMASGRQNSESRRGLENYRRFVPAGKARTHVTGTIFLEMDSHSTFPPLQRRSPPSPLTEGPPPPLATRWGAVALMRIVLRKQAFLLAGGKLCPKMHSEGGKGGG